jgi:hypothetical protein
MAVRRMIRAAAATLLALGLVVAGLAFLLRGVQADSDTDTAEGAVLTGNYCAECHVSGDARVQSALAWGGGVYRQESIPCDPLRLLREERHHAGNLMLKIADAGEQFSGDRMGAETLIERVDPERDSFDKLMQTNVDSVAEFTGTAKALRFESAKVLPDALDLYQENNRRTVILAIVLGTIFVAFLGFFAWERTLKK